MPHRDWPRHLRISDRFDDWLNSILSLCQPLFLQLTLLFQVKLVPTPTSLNLAFSTRDGPVKIQLPQVIVSVLFSFSFILCGKLS